MTPNMFLNMRVKRFLSTSGFSKQNIAAWWSSRTLSRDIKLTGCSSAETPARQHTSSSSCSSSAMGWRSSSAPGHNPSRPTRTTATESGPPCCEALPHRDGRRHPSRLVPCTPPPCRRSPYPRPCPPHHPPPPLPPWWAPRAGWPDQLRANKRKRSWLKSLIQQHSPYNLSSIIGLSLIRFKWITVACMCVFSPEWRCVYGGVCPILSPIRGFLLLITSLWMRRLWYRLFLRRWTTQNMGHEVMWCR